MPEQQVRKASQEITLLLLVHATCIWVLFFAHILWFFTTVWFFDGILLLFIRCKAKVCITTLVFQESQLCLQHRVPK